jgi:predicted HAD superfamily hydrolase
MNLTRSEFAILSDAVDDRFGLWEVADGIQQLYPDSNSSEVRRIAKETSMEMYSKGWLSLFRRISLGDPDLPVTAEEVNTVLLDDSNWNVPSEDSIEILIEATEQGKKVYYSQSQSEPSKA